MNRLTLHPWDGRQALDPDSPPDVPLALALPLCGSRLIEASAGTGKTFTIAALYVRLVLGHGADASFGRELLPPEILVMTFTEAATQELRDRIRTRLAQAARFFRDEIDAPDDLIEAMRDDFDESQWPSCANKLDIAAQWMDEAAVSTIHGWCQRMLREHAFDSGSLFTQTLETDHADLIAQVVRDYWRQHCYGLEGAALDWVQTEWGTPAGLQSRLAGLLSDAPPSAPDGDLAALLDGALAEKRQRLAGLKAPWGEWAEQLRQLCDDACRNKQIKPGKLQARYYNGWCDALRTWAQTPELELLKLDTGYTRLTPSGLAEIWLAGEPPDHPALDAMVQLRGELAALPRPDAVMLQHAAAWVSQRFDAEKRRRAEMGFDDMLNRLDAALAGVNGERLADVIRNQFPVALVDEFQDTDPVQYRILDAIYQVDAHRGDSALLMIGDPKQAIYAFRGADIYTYLRARAATAPRHYTLGTNFRSTAGMVEAVNHVFAQAEERPAGQGAFLFRSPMGNPVPFQPVEANDRTETFVVDHEAAVPLTCWHIESTEPIPGGAYRELAAAGSATEIVRLLQLAQTGQAGFARPDGAWRALRPADIAVLVRDFAQARAIRGALAERGVRSVYLSDRDSVFDTAEAQDLLLWLKACAEPDDDRPLRAALATRTLSLTLAELDQMNRDERVWEQRVLQFRAYRELWRSQGVLPMLRRLLHDFDLPRSVMTRPDGERVLTNLLHLAELMQQAATELDGEQALIRHLAQHLLAPANSAEDQVLRLESDEQLLKVVTIHKSKGLEYPLVFLPFICAFRPVDKDDAQVRFHDERGALVVRLQPSADDVARADHERLAEDLRLLYVALTRSRSACWLAWADLRKGLAKPSVLHGSAPGYLAAAGQPLASSAELPGWLHGLAGDCPHISVLPLPEASPAAFLAADTERPTLQARTMSRRVAENWWIASYSALSIEDGQGLDGTPSDAEHRDRSPETPQAQKIFDDDLPDPAAFESPAVRTRTAITGEGLHHFPRGPNPGTFLHGLMEWAGEEGFAGVAADRAAVEDAVARRCNRRGLQHWVTPLTDWVMGMLNDDLPLGEPGTSVRFSALLAYQVEMEFWFSSAPVDVGTLDQMVRAHTLAGAPRPALRQNTLNGMFKGFIDLVFEHQGRFYVADYKSNWLGEDDAAYLPSRMRDEILGKRYDLQYVLYLLALHRQLKARLPDYEYDTHVGGALYLFVRGYRSATQGVFFDRPPRELIEGLDALFSGAVASGAREAA